MSLKKPLILILLTLLLISGCELFTTRTPEMPDDNAINYPPATSPVILITNFNNSIKSLNPDNYYDCLLKNNENNFIYQYIPDPDAQARYGIIFTQWNALSERNFMNGLKSSVEFMITPQFDWEDEKFEVMTSDSAIYFGQYKLIISLQKKSEIFQGIARLVLFRSNSGLWFIKTWQDFQLNSSDTLKTFSILKGVIST